MNQETSEFQPGLLRTSAEGIGRITISNPSRRNAMTLEMWAAIPVLLEGFQNDDEIRVLIITGAGAQAFVSGADISQFSARRAGTQDVAAYERTVALALQSIREFPKPVIARINGHCIGGGLALALACDLRVAQDDALFGIPAARLGLGYEYPGIQKLVGLVGEARATEMLFTARFYSAQEADAMGMLHRLTTHDALDAAVDGLATEIAGRAPLTIQAAKMAIRAAAAFGDPALVRQADALAAQCAVSQDYAEGIAAFLEKRPAHFQGI